MSPKAKKTTIAAAVALLFAPPLLAQTVTPPTQVSIIQVNGNPYTVNDPRNLADSFFLEQEALNAIFALSVGTNAAVIQSLGVGSVGGVQLGTNQFQTVGGLSTLGAPITPLNIELTEVDVSLDPLVETYVRGSAVIDQIIGQDFSTGADVGDGTYFSGNSANVDQYATNVINLVAVPTAGVGNVVIRGQSQIGANAANVAAANLSYGGELQLTQRVNQLDQRGDVWMDGNEQFVYNSGGGINYANLGEDEIDPQGRLVQDVQNLMFATLEGRGEAIIDGASGTNLDQKASQYGANTVNAALVAGATGTQSQLALDQSFGASSYWYGEQVTHGAGYFSSFYYYDGASPSPSRTEYLGRAAYQGYYGSVTNIAQATAENRYALPSAPPRQPVEQPALDPRVANLDQIAAFSGNVLNIVSPANVAATETTPALASVTLTGKQEMTSPRQIVSEYRYVSNNGYRSGFTGDPLYRLSIEYGSYAEVPFQLSNAAIAANGNPFVSVGEDGELAYANQGYYGEDYPARGDSVIDNVSQFVLANINTVAVNGPTTTTGEGAARVTTTATAGLIDVDGFVQQVNGLVVLDRFGEDGSMPYVADPFRTGEVTLSSAPDPVEDSYGRAQYVANVYAPWGNYDNYSVAYYPGTRANGNLALAYTEIGNAAATNLEQLQSLNVNSLSTTGDLRGYRNEDGYVLGEDTPSMTQLVNDIDVTQTNLGIALTREGVASASGEQTLSFALNSLAVGGTLSGDFEQIARSDLNGDLTVRQANLLSAQTGSGVARIGDFSVNGSLTASPVTQVVVSSINAMSLGSVADATLSQIIDNTGARDNELLQSSTNVVQAGGPGVRLTSLSNITQQVQNRVNTIAAAVPPAPQQ